MRDADEVGLTLTRVSDRKEMEFGSELAKQFEPSIASDSTLQKYVSEIGQRLVGQVRRRGIRYEFHVIDSGGINAFALPGGKIYVTAGLLKFATSEAAVAEIIAHEISHVDLRHCIERFQYELLIRRILPSDLAAISRLPYSLLAISYNEQQEREADVDAIIMMANAGYHPKYGISIFDRMGALTGGERRTTPPTYLIEELGTAVWEALREYFQTHPSLPDRINTMTAVLRRNEPKWKDRQFYVGRFNHAQRTSWITQPIDGELRPYIEPPALVDYLSGEYLHFKAMAVNLPYGLSSVASNEATPSTAIERALSQCERKIKPCQLYALGDKVVLGVSADQLHSIISEYSKTGGTAREYRSYRFASDFKAFAIDRSSGRTGTGVGHATPKKAIEEAIARCSEGGGTCELYAVGEVVVQGLQKEQIDSAVDQYRQKIVAGRIAKLQKAYLENRTYGDFKALAVDYQYGHFGVSERKLTLTAAIEEAIARCSEGGSSCELYAVGNVVVYGLAKELADAAIEQYRQRIIAGRTAKLEKEYLDRRTTYEDFKALAVDYGSARFAVSQAQPTPSKAIESAIAHCSTQKITCKVHAIGGTIVQDKTKDERDSIARHYAWEAIERVTGNKLREYLSKREFRAFVVDVPGRHWSYQAGHWHPLAALNLALKWCHERGRDCEAVFVGDTFVFDRSKDSLSGMIDEYNSRVTWPTDRLNPLREYMNEPRFTDFKAFAAAPDGKNWQRESGYSSPYKAIEETVALCRSRNASCELYAIGSHIVYGQSDEEKRAATTTYAREVLENKLGFFRQPSYANFKAVAGNPYIMTYGLSLSYGRASARDAVQEAMRTCNEQFTSCQIFAVGEMIVFDMPQEDIDRITEQYQRDVDASHQISN